MTEEKVTIVEKWPMTIINDDIGEKVLMWLFDSIIEASSIINDIYYYNENADNING